MTHFSRILLLLFISIFAGNFVAAQLVITNQSDARLLVQKLLGNGIVVSNISLVGAPIATGFFNNISGSKLGIDSGIVLTNGRAKTQGSSWGLDGDGSTMASAALADKNNQLAGDGDIARIIGVPIEQTHDATVLEFDFVSLGDSIQFRYVFSSEEYTPEYVCEFNDAFAFFISGPGIAGGVRNIALVPGTNIPVSIFNVNDVAGGLCPNNMPYFTDNKNNRFFTHDGHTTVLTAQERVIPCQTYHLKLVIADVGDYAFDSGVFLEAKSLSSNTVNLSSITQVDPLNNAYLVEGCASGIIKIQRPNPDNSPLNVQLSYAGTAVNGTDVQLLPLTVTIPANQTEVSVNIIPIIDNVPEGIETLKIYALAGNTCGPSTPSDSAIIQIRDYDTLGVIPDAAVVCKNIPLQLNATSGYTSYRWDANSTLNNLAVRNPFALPVNAITTYYCTATQGTCQGRDSAVVVLKMLRLLSKSEINCTNDAVGIIKVSGGGVWAAPVLYAINNNPYQTDSTFSNLPVGVYTVKIKDASGCTDSLVIPITQLYPNLVITGTGISPASCSGDADGTALINVSGGKNPYLFSTDGINFQNNNSLTLHTGNYLVTVKDDNSCITTKNIFIPLNNTVTLDAGSDTTICEGRSAMLRALSNALIFSWSPAVTLDNSSILTPTASPVFTTKYIITATTGICQQKDSATIFVNPAPKANAGPDQMICFAQNATLAGSGGLDYYWHPSSFLDNAHIASPVAKQLTGSFSYFLNVIDAKGCVSLKQDTVLVTVVRPAVVNAGRDTTLAMGQPLTLVAADVNHIGFTQYQWSPSYGLDNPFTASPTTVLDKDMHYYVTASNSIGCTATDDIKIKVYRGPDIYVPNAFSPDGNGLNDILKAIPVGIKDFHYFRIYNRWGNIVFNASNPLNGWDGTTAGTSPVAGTYIWMAEGVDYKGNIIQRKGTVIIVK